MTIDLTLEFGMSTNDKTRTNLSRHLTELEPRIRPANEQDLGYILGHLHGAKVADYYGDNDQTGGWWGEISWSMRRGAASCT